MIPLELITMLGAGLMSGVMTMWSQSLKAKQEAHMQFMDKIETKNAAVDVARKYSSKGFQWTRRIVTLSAVFAIIVWPKIVPVFWFFTDGVDVTVWKTAKGLVLTPLDTHIMSAIIGLYFGSSVVKNT